MALGRVSDLLRSSFLLSKGSVAFRGCGHLEARTACRSETHMPLVLILGQSPRLGCFDFRERNARTVKQQKIRNDA